MPPFAVTISRCHLLGGYATEDVESSFESNSPISDQTHTEHYKPLYCVHGCGGAGRRHSALSAPGTPRALPHVEAISATAKAT